MVTTTVTFRTDLDIKGKAERLFDSLGMNMSLAINMFLRQAVRENRFPCALDADIANDAKATYPPGFFEFFGCLDGYELDEPEELSFAADAPREDYGV